MAIEYKWQKVHSDSICCEIPMNITADLGVAIRKTREKRLKLIYEKYPHLERKDASEEEEEDGDEEVEEDEEGGATGSTDGEPKRKKLKSESKPSAPNKKATDPSVPQRDQYGSVVDYLEAKYVRGVMIQDENDGIGDDGAAGSEKGSVYGDASDADSFLDDSLLRRDVAEQVMNQATHTKLELEEEDADFFVNVGTLEVEDHDLVDYDPLDVDKEALKKGTSGSKKKASAKSTGASKKSSTASAKKESNTKTSAAESKKDQPKKKPVEAIAMKKEEPSKPSISKEAIEKLEKKAIQLRRKVDKLEAEVIESFQVLTDKELPRKNRTEKVSITVPEGKTVGDDVTFTNPHVKGQKLRVKVPKSSEKSGKFVVSVPVPNPLATREGDHNKFPRHLQAILDEFSAAFDEWLSADGAAKEAAGIKKKVTMHHERMGKFDKMLENLPKDLCTPLDGVYLRKVVRRARQNKAKRVHPQAPKSTTAAAGKTEPDESHPTPKTVDLELPVEEASFVEMRLNMNDFL